MASKKESIKNKNKANEKQKNSFFRFLRMRIIELIVLFSCFSLLFTCPYKTQRIQANLFTQQVCEAGDFFYGLFKHTPIYPYYFRFVKPSISQVRTLYNQHGRSIIDNYSSKAHDQYKHHLDHANNIYENNVKHHYDNIYPKVSHFYQSSIDPMIQQVKPYKNQICEKVNVSFHQYFDPIYTIYDEKVGSYVNDACCQYGADCCDKTRHLKDKAKYGFSEIKEYILPSSDSEKSKKSDEDKLTDKSSRISDDDN